MRYIFSDESFCYLCTLVLFTEINNAKIVSYLNSIFLQKVASTIIWVILVYFIITLFYFKHDIFHYNT